VTAGGGDAGDRRRLVAWLFLILASAGLHLWDVGSRSFHHDESLHARMSWNLAERGTYRYDPTYHGPVLYMVTAAVFVVLPDTDATARLPVVAAGIGLLWVCWGLRRHMGERAAWWTGLVITISPTLLYFGRFLRMDVPELLFASAALLAFLDALTGRSRAWVFLGVWAGLALATKENAYVTMALLGATAAFVAVDRGLGSATRQALPWVMTQRWNILTCAVIAGAVSTTLYTVGWTRPEDAFFPIRAVGYWWNQHQVQRVAGPWWFHLPRLVQYEFLVLGAALAWCTVRLRQLRGLEFFLMIFGASSVVMYAYLGEKVPWLIVHQTWAFYPLAGIALAHVFGPEGRLRERLTVSLGLAATVVCSLSVNFWLEEITPRSPRVESVHFVQTTPEFAELARTLTRVDPADGTVHVHGNALWPLNWYLRNHPTEWRLPTREDRPAAVVCDPEDALDVRAVLGPGFRQEVVPIRSWWLMEAGRPSWQDWVRYFLTRRAWGNVGSTSCTVFVREVAAVP
jgi:uncharacterized protein (TIGR03663 family)